MILSHINMNFKVLCFSLFALNINFSMGIILFGFPFVLICLLYDDEIIGLFVPYCLKILYNNTSYENHGFFFCFVCNSTSLKSKPFQSNSCFIFYLQIEYFILYIFYSLICSNDFYE